MYTTPVAKDETNKTVKSPYLAKVRRQSPSDQGGPSFPISGCFHHQKQTLTFLKEEILLSAAE